jgi:outer membrane protein TolC
MLIALVMALAASQPEASGEKIMLTMEQAVELGADKSFRLQRSVRNNRIADQRLRGTRAGLGPRLDVTYGANQSQRYYDFQGTYDYNQGQPAFYTDATANASYNLDISGVQRRQVRQATLSRQSSEIDLRQTTLEVSADIRISEADRQPARASPR